MPQFSPLWFINIISWTFAIISFLVWYNQAIILPSIVRLNLSRTIMLFNSQVINSTKN
uniref:ATP synthase protein 8 n=1 Tax=Rhizophydium sp. 136 TaxID=60187 RepID=Q950M5_9FUNG|nr:ATP synthase F0 subunit 8 [Rhizophydium sp. 136]AAK84283.1 ATP synthase F0 subunit 8 [Rhizophydium sp. 136]